MFKWAIMLGLNRIGDPDDNPNEQQEEVASGVVVLTETLAGNPSPNTPLILF